MRVVLQLSVLLNISISQYPEQRHFYNGEQPRGGCSRDSARGYTGSLKWRESAVLIESSIIYLGYSRPGGVHKMPPSRNII